CMSSEYSKGTLLLLVTKGLARPSVILAKYTVAAVIMTVSFWLSFAGAYGYTYYLWPDTFLSNVISAAFFMWMIGFLYLSILILGCVLFKQTFTSILFTGGIVALFSVLSVVKPLSAFNPVVLTSRNVDLISGEIPMTEFLIPFIIAAVLSVVFLAAAISVFNKKQL
ncbi:MAG TPA: ABC transporter permease, partial [Candidatus Blautia intestinavium]|nr:ABC transporter permease [Candidatus Blautia intestinavium]